MIFLHNKGDIILLDLIDLLVILARDMDYDNS